VTAILVYDTTLRDGMQGEGMSLSAGEKLRVAHVLDDLGVGMIEAGFPASNPKEEAFFDLLSRETFRNDIAAFGMTRRRDLRAEDDPALRLLADCFAPVVTLVGKTWGLHLEKVVKVDREENLRMIEESVAFLVAQGKQVVYDAEHFFDGYADDPAYAKRCLRAAEAGGASWLVLCDTNGASLPHQVAAATGALHPDFDSLGIHCHNDAECAVANSLAAVAEGARMVQGTMNGYGERCGNANLVSIVPNLQLKMGRDCLDDLAKLTETAHWLDELLNFTPDPNQPYVGKNAFAHKGGMHVAGVNADPATFEHIDPALVGNAREVLVSELAGKGSLMAKGDLDPETAARVVDRVKELEHEGFQFEAADGSLDLLIRRVTGEYEPLFRLESWRVIAEKRAGPHGWPVGPDGKLDPSGAVPDGPGGGEGKVQTEATIKIWMDGERYVRTAEGNGPVNALDRALRDAIGERHPHLRDIKLVNYKVRILDEAKATGATTRVLLDASDGVDTWGAIGVHENVIEASWDALVDSLEAGMLPGRIGHSREASRTATR
jgi:2-isopropylmalate synthase